MVAGMMDNMQTCAGSWPALLRCCLFFLPTFLPFAQACIIYSLLLQVVAAAARHHAAAWPHGSTMCLVTAVETAAGVAALLCPSDSPGAPPQHGTISGMLVCFQSSILRSTSSLAPATKLCTALQPERQPPPPSFPRVSWHQYYHH